MENLARLHYCTGTSRICDKNQNYTILLTHIIVCVCVGGGGGGGGGATS